MREIKFRGKRVDNEEWVYGYYTVRVINGRGDLEHRICQPGGRFDKIIPETIGQFSGVKDKNDKEIYEGDIIYSHNICENWPEWLVIYHPGICAFQLRSLDDLNEWGVLSTANCQDIKIIDNIHDNPELLEQ